MPRSKRRKSGTDVYHVVSRGNDQMDILPQDGDKKYFRGLMKKEADRLGVEIYAYCVMSNHHHMLVKTDFKNLSQFMKEVNFRYAVYYNGKYDHSGHVFQGRFYSSGVETEAYLLSCIRYIHNNPVKAYIVPDILEYPFSSAAEYFSDFPRDFSGKLSENIKFRKGCISQEIVPILNSRFENIEDFLKFHNIFDSQEFIDIDEEKSEYDYLRVKHFIELYKIENEIKDSDLLGKVPSLRDEFITRCSRETGLAKNRIKNILKMVIKGA